MQQSAKSAPWTRWYRHRRWKRLRLLQLAAEPLCVMCKLAGKIEPATVVDHIERHFGDPEKFWHGKLQSVCRHCHEVRKKFVESRGYSREIDPTTGWPKDARHPANLPRDAFRRFGFGIPHYVQPSAIPVTLVCGPPASGKTTWINARRQAGDTVISLDECKLRVGGRAWDTERSVLRRALALRDTMLRSLAIQRSGRAFIELGAPTQDERDAWCRALGTTNIVLLNVSADVCISRVRADPARAHAVQDLVNAVQRWHHLYRQPPRVNVVTGSDTSGHNPAQPDTPRRNNILPEG